MNHCAVSKINALWLLIFNKVLQNASVACHMLCRCRVNKSFIWPILRTWDKCNSFQFGHVWTFSSAGVRLVIWLVIEWTILYHVPIQLTFEACNSFEISVIIITRQSIFLPKTRTVITAGCTTCLISSSVEAFSFDSGWLHALCLWGCSLWGWLDKSNSKQSFNLGSRGDK